MPEFHDQFWRKILQRIQCAIEFFQFILDKKAELLDLHTVKPCREIHIGKKKHIFDLLFEISLKDSSNSMYFLLELIGEMEETKRIDFLEEMEDYIFQSRKDGSTRLVGEPSRTTPTVAFARGGDYGKTKNDDLVRKGSGRGN